MPIPPTGRRCERPTRDDWRSGIRNDPEKTAAVQGRDTQQTRVLGGARVETRDDLRVLSEVSSEEETPAALAELQRKRLQTERQVLPALHAAGCGDYWKDTGIPGTSGKRTGDDGGGPQKCCEKEKEAQTFTNDLEHRK